MKKLNTIFCITLLSFLGIQAQEYQYEGEVDGREATLLLHFVTATDNPDEIWSHGSFYYNDEGIANVIFQYKPTVPAAGELSFNIIPTNVNQVNYILGDVTKSSFVGKYKVDGRVFPIDFQTKINQPLIVFNYYKEYTNKAGNRFKYFGKFISQENQTAYNKLTQYLSESTKRMMPRTYLENVYNNDLQNFKDSNSDELHNLAIFPIVVTEDRIVYKMTDYIKQGSAEIRNNVSFINYDVRKNEVIDANNLFQPGSQSQIQKIIDTQAKTLGDASSQALNNTNLPYTDNFYLAEGGIVFYYPNVMLSNGSLENYQVYVKYDQLEGLLQ